MIIRPASPSDLSAVFALRFEVFVDEQGVPREIELDDEDATAFHILAEEDGTVVGCARLLFHGDGSAHIGRLAVKRSLRGKGIGAAVCRFCIEQCRARGCTVVRLHAQLQAAGFYEKLGFIPHGEVFLEAGIEHREMEMPLALRGQIALRPFSGSDHAPLHGLWLNEDIKKTYMIPDFDSTEALDRAITRFMDMSHNASHFVRGIYLGDDLIGFVNDVDMKGDTVEVGYVIHPAEWGKGYATAALSETIASLFGRGFSVVRAGAFEENAASLRVMEKCGMVRCDATETVEYRGGTHACVYCEVRAEELRKGGVQ